VVGAAAAVEVVVSGGGDVVGDVVLVTTTVVVVEAVTVVEDGVCAASAVSDVLARVVVGVGDHCHSVDGCASATGTGGGELVARKINTEQTNAPAVVAHTKMVLPRRLRSRCDQSAKGSIARSSIRHCAQAASPK
jgi:hypothetical protein